MTTCNHEPITFIPPPGMMWRSTCLHCGVWLINPKWTTAYEPDDEKEWYYYDFDAYAARKPWRYAEIRRP